MMGSPDTETDRSSGETQHEVTITKDFYLGKYEAHQGQWEAVIDTAILWPGTNQQHLWSKYLASSILDKLG